MRKCRTLSIFRKKNPYGLHSGHTTSVSLDSWSPRCAICILFTAFLWIRKLAQKSQKKCNTLRNLDFRVCESVELSAFSEKKIHTACILDTRRAYRSSPGAPDARSKHYLLHLGFSGVRKCRTVSIFRKKKSIRLAFWTHDERIARLLELPMHDLHII